MVGDDGTVAAVLDWELCTLGDPLADLGLLIVYWTEPDDAQGALLDGADHGGRASRPASEVIARYAGDVGPRPVAARLLRRLRLLEARLHPRGRVRALRRRRHGRGQRVRGASTARSTALLASRRPPTVPGSGSTVEPVDGRSTS